jgi:hypothetical protein
MKKITFAAKPAHGVASAHADAWVNDRQPAGEPIKRLTVDVPISLHRRIKSQCALRNENMADAIRVLLEKQFPEEYQGTRAGGERFGN